MPHSATRQSGSEPSKSRQSESKLSKSGRSEYDQPESESESLKKALADDDNVLVPMRYAALRDEFLTSIEAKTAGIEEMVRLLLRVSSSYLSVREVWMSGSFNVAIPVRLPWNRSVFLRLPLPYRIGEEQCPGNTEEKLRTEIATYLWLKEHCPDVPIPVLHAFGLPDGSTFTHPSNTPFWERTWWAIKRLFCSLTARPVPTRHVRRRFRHSLGAGFLLISQASGKSLTWSWPDHCHDNAYRERLFQGLARISLSLNATPFPRIGSLSLRPDGSIALCNRPLNLYFQMLENEGIPSGVPRHRTYSHVEPYLSDLISLQDSKLRNQPNAMHSQDDAQRQLAALTALRAVMHLYIRPESREGPFFLTLTDLYRQNIFVDKDWNIQTIIDLEWAHTMPLQMQLPPFWLTSKLIDDFKDDDSIAEYDAVLEEYLTIYEAEEKRRNGSVVEASAQRDGWRDGSFWYFHALTVPKAMYNLFSWHIQPLFNEDHHTMKIFDEVFYRYWGFGAQDLIDKKLRDKEDYLARVRKAFE